MNNSTGISKTAGRIGSLVGVVGVVAFFVGIFGGPRSLAFAGVALIITAFVAFFIEEQVSRRKTT